MSYRKLEIWQEVRELSIKIPITLSQTFFEPKSLTDGKLHLSLHEALDELGGQISNFLKAVEKDHNKNYPVSEPAIRNPESSIEYRESNIHNRES